MIVREWNGFYYATTQPEHARQSAVITASLKPEFLGPPDDHREILLATLHHDDGWARWEAEPDFREDGLPVNFTEIDREEHGENWYGTIFTALSHLSPMAAAMIARHAGTFIEKTHGPEAAEHQQGLIRALQNRAWPGLDETEQDQKLERGFLPLFFGDALSLIPVAGWNDEQHLALQHANGERIHVRARLDGPWTVRVDPWPFAPPALRNVFIDAIAIPRDRKSDSRQFLRRPADHLIRIPIDYLPG